MATFQTLPGFRDCFPEEFAHRNHLFRCWRRTAASFGFAEYDAPVLEALDLYRAKSGDEIENQLFSFTDKGGREVALRPEMTPTVCRMIAARANALKRPIKWFNVGEFYRYERMQRGRGRSFFQLNADIFGEPGPEAEIELIALLVQSLTAFGLTAEDFRIRLSDRNLWFAYLEGMGLDEPRIRVLLGAIDKYERAGDDAFKDYVAQFGALEADRKEQLLAFLQVRSLPALEAIAAKQPVGRFAERLDDWRTLLGGLEAMGLGDFVHVDLGVVRGLAYYTGFVFEAFDAKGELRAIAGGGRYDDLVRKLGGPELPAVGFAIGDMTFSLLLEQRGLVPTLISAPDVYCVIDGAAGRSAAFPHVAALRDSGFRVEYALRCATLAFGKQLKAATDSGARLALIYGGDEVGRGVVKLRDLTDRSEREVSAAEVVAAVRATLGG